MMMNSGSGRNYLHFSCLLCITIISMIEAKQKHNLSPTSPPTKYPTNHPTFLPTVPPTAPPTSNPTQLPTKPPTFAPTNKPTQHARTQKPSLPPTMPPTLATTPKPTKPPSTPPTLAPTLQPTPPTTTSPQLDTNDSCNTAQSISGVATSTLFETASISSPGARYNVCLGFYGYHPSKWFSYEPPNGCVVATASSSSSYVVQVYEGSCDSNTCVTPTAQGVSMMSWLPTAGTTYLVAVFAEPNSGNFLLNVTCELPTTNDSCDTALPISTGITTFETSSLSYPGAPFTDCFGINENFPTKWYTFVADATDSYSVATATSTTGYGLLVYEGGCGSSTCVTAVDGTQQGGDSVTWVPTTGKTYVLAAFARPNSGDFELNITYANNDSCEGALPISTGFTLFETDNSSSPFTDCNGVTVDVPVKWFSFVAEPGCNTAVVSSYPSVFVFAGSCASKTCVSGIDKTVQGNENVAWAPTPGATYFIATLPVAGGGDSAGVTVTCHQ